MLNPHRASTRKSCPRCSKRTSPQGASRRRGVRDTRSRNTRRPAGPRHRCRPHRPRSPIDRRVKRVVFSAGTEQQLLENPGSKEESLRMLMGLNGDVCEVTTGVSVILPVLKSPYDKISSIDELALVYFADNSPSLLKGSTLHSSLLPVYLSPPTFALLFA